MILEIACFSYSDALIAIEGGASRIELCRGQSYGGLTPSKNAGEELCKNSPVPVFIMIRPPGKNFLYGPADLDNMKKWIRFYKKQKCAGFVFGALDENQKVNKRQCRQLVNLAKPLPCTFHRAFDLASDLEETLEDVIACGFKRILTSGGKGKAHENLDSLKRLFKKAGKRIVLVPGGGVRAENIAAIIAATKCREIHSAATNPDRNRISLKEIQNLKNKLS